LNETTSRLERSSPISEVIFAQEVAKQGDRWLEQTAQRMHRYQRQMDRQSAGRAAALVFCLPRREILIDLGWMSEWFSRVMRASFQSDHRMT
jgi:hypothetical protein